MNATPIRHAVQASRTLLSSSAALRANRVLQELQRQQRHRRPFSQTTTSTFSRSRQRPLSVSSLCRNLRTRLQRRPYSSPKAPSPNPTPHLGSPEPTGLSARLKKLSREYGWTAVGVYLALSALDFPFCFMAVRLLGTDRIGRAEHAVVSAFWRAVEWVLPDWIDGGKVAVGNSEAGVVDAQLREGGAGWGVEAAEKANNADNASLGTQLALAYAIHKSFIFIRVPLTAAILPRVVKTLRGWGWNIGKRAKP